ncbi:MAG: lysoplasmalogenase [Saprospiraceae bacterium]|nr:lysoplasmalogenase [Saprospiraceae bacterium]
MKNVWLPLFLMVALAHLAGVAMEHRGLVVITKPMLMPLLAVWLAVETRHGQPRFLKKMMFAGLSFSTVGDVLLLWGGKPLFFILGLVAFLFAHLSYIGGFSSMLRRSDKGFLSRRPVWALWPVLAAVALVWSLWSGIPDEMKLPVGIYTAVITTMVLSVFNLKGSVTAPIFQTLLAGALLFMLSDSLIAWSRFDSPFPFSGLAIMGTYIAGQFLLARGACEVLR